MLAPIIIIVVIKMIGLFFIERFAKNSVIFELVCSFTFTSSVDKRFNSDGNNVNVIKKDVIKPNVIIHPKSIIGFISLKISDRKAQIVVKTV